MEGVRAGEGHKWSAPPLVKNPVGAHDYLLLLCRIASNKINYARRTKCTFKCREICAEIIPAEIIAVSTAERNTCEKLLGLINCYKCVDCIGYWRRQSI